MGWRAKYTAHENQVIRRHYPSSASAIDFQKNFLPDRTVVSIRHQASRLRVKQPCKNWTKQEDAIVRRMYGKRSYTDIAASIRSNTGHIRPIASIHTRAYRLGITQSQVFPLTSRVIGHLSENEKYYLAGLVDGEGCFTTHRDTRRGSFTPAVVITNTNIAMIRWLEQALREHAGVHKRKKMVGWKQCFVVYFTGNKAVVFAREIKRYLVAKRGQANLMSRYRHDLPRATKERIRTKIGGLNQTGTPR